MAGRPRSWTDDDLIRALAAATSLREVLDRLGLPRGGRALGGVRRRILELAAEATAADAVGELTLDEAVVTVLIRGRHALWTDEDLAAAVAASPSMEAVMRRLGLASRGAALTAAEAHAASLGLDTSTLQPLRPPAHVRRPRRHRTWTDDDLQAAVRASTSVAGVLRFLGLKVGGGQYVAIQRRMRELGLDRTHFTGQGWRLGSTRPVVQARPLEQLLVRNSTIQSTAYLRRRLLREGIKEAVCERCGRVEWNGAPIPLQLDHINGDRTDNRLENLRLLCPNCHAQTETWCSRNRGRYDRLAPVLELVYRPGSKPGAFGHEGSSPSGRTVQLSFGDLDALD